MCRSCPRAQTLALGSRHEFSNQPGKFPGPCDRSKVTGSFDCHAARTWDETCVLGAPLNWYDVIEVELPGDDERRSTDAPAIFNEVDARDQSSTLSDARQRQARGDERPQLLGHEPEAIASPRKRRDELAPQPKRRFGEEQWPEEPGHARVHLVPLAEMPRGSRCRYEDERGGTFRMRHREADGDDTTERHAADRRAIDSPGIENRDDLRQVVIEPQPWIEAESAPALAA